MSALTVSPIKLRNGSWGVKGPGILEPEMAVVVKTKAGKTWTAMVTKVVWRGNGTAIAATQSLDRPARRSSNYQRVERKPMPGRCKGCGGPVRDCARHPAMDGYCGACAFDEFDC